MARGIKSAPASPVVKKKVGRKKKYGAITDDDAKEMISLCLVGLHCSTGRLNISTSKFDRQSCDLTLEYENLAPKPNEWALSYLNIQAKATSKPQYDKSKKCLLFDLPVKNYNDLRRRQQHRSILAIAVLDGHVDECIQYGDCVQVKARIYYRELLNEPPTKNTKTVQVAIPMDNVFDFQVAKKMLHDISTRVFNS